MGGKGSGRKPQLDRARIVATVLPTPTLAALDKQAGRDGRSRSEAIRAAIDAALEAVGVPDEVEEE